MSIAPTILQKKKPKTNASKRTAISLETKKALCLYKRDHPNCSAKKMFNLNVDRSTITKILAESERWIKKDTSGKAGQLMKERKESFVKTNNALSHWVTSAIVANNIINGKILQIKALEFAQQFPEESHFKASDGWLDGFKKLNNLHQVRLHGEANSVPLATLPEERDNLREIIGKYSLNDVYNADETSLFFRMPPNMTLATGNTFGTKRDKIRITVLLACNATGNDCTTGKSCA